jgi:GDP-L-fucose synthase
MDKKSKIYIAGHGGLVGSAILRKLEDEGYDNIICKTSKELDLTKQGEVLDFFIDERPEYVFLAAAKVGGIHANSTYPADFSYINQQIQTNIIHASYLFKVKKLLFLGSSCIYPKQAETPIKEEALLTGPLEDTNRAYAIAKIAGIEMCRSYNKQYGTDFISAMPCNMFGPGDNYHPENSHVIPALIRKIHEAKEKGYTELPMWGTGRALREFLHSDDLAEACTFLMTTDVPYDLINIGTGLEISIRNLALSIKEIVGFEGRLVYDRDKPDGTIRKTMDSSKINRLGWEPKKTLIEGLKESYKDFLESPEIRSK